MSYIKQILLIVLIVFLFLIQNSHPAILTVAGLNPNFLFCFSVALLVVFDWKIIWRLVIIIVAFMEINTSLFWGTISLTVALSGLAVIQLKKIIIDQILLYLLLPLAACLAYGLIMIIISLLIYNIEWQIVWQLISNQIIYEFIINYLISLLFVGVLSQFFVKKKSIIKFQLSNNN